MTLSFIQKVVIPGSTSLLTNSKIPAILSSSDFFIPFHIDNIIPEIVKLAGKRKSQYLKLQSRRDDDSQIYLLLYSD